MISKRHSAKPDQAIISCRFCNIQWHISLIVSSFHDTSQLLDAFAFVFVNFFDMFTSVKTPAVVHRSFHSIDCIFKMHELIKNVTGSRLYCVCITPSARHLYMQAAIKPKVTIQKKHTTTVKIAWTFYLEMCSKQMLDLQ